MVSLKSFISVIVCFLLSSHFLVADPIGKKNLGFEQGNFAGWEGYTWIYRTDDPSASTGKVAGIVSGRHTIMSDQSAYDANTGGKLKIIPDGYTYSAKLGSEQKGGRHQSLSYTMKIDSSNALLVWKFAVVLQDPERGHEVYEEPRFTITLFDEKGDTIPDCSNYDVHATDAKIGGFQTYTASGSDSPIVWRDWTTVGANLLPYYGKTITIEFMGADCTHRNHFGYGYLVVDCMPLLITVDYCTGDSNATLSAPSGFNTYLWKNEKGDVVDSVQNLLIEEPKEGETFICDLESETGCSVSLSTQIARYDQEAGFSSEMLDCNSNTVSFSNSSSHSRGTLSYLWDFGDGNTSDEKDPVYKFLTSGLHDVSLIIYNPPSGCTDTLYQVVESFSPPLVGFTGDSTYCPGLETELTAYGAYRYEWSTGNSDETISFGAPGGNYWFLGYSSQGCVSDTIRVAISEEPDWYFGLLGDTILCEGFIAPLIAEGASEYRWNTGETNDSILISNANTYSVTGANVRGCYKQLSIKVKEVANPTMGYSLSTNTINIRQNIVECSATSVDEVSFQWDMGDGTIASGAFYSHAYTTPSELIRFPVTVSAINKFGCSKIVVDSVAVDIFIPNVFTPNNDGVNDFFMPGYSQKIFDRFGIIIYNGEDGWNGYYKGKNADPDTYYYILNYANAYGEERIRKGFITLVR